MNFPLYIAKRYLRSKSSNNAINFITNIALIGIILGSASLFVVLSGFAGLKDFTLEFTNEIDPDLKALPANGKSFILSEDEIANLNALDEIASFSKIIEERTIVSSQDKKGLAIIKGVDGNFHNVVNIGPQIDHGSWLEQNSNQIVTGLGIASNLSLGILDFTTPVNLYVPKPGKKQISSIKGAFNTVKAANVGVFFINEKLSDNYIYAPISLVRQLLNYEQNQVSAVEFKLQPNTDESIALQRIQSVLGDKIIIKNRVQLNDALYKMLNSEYLAVYLIFTLILIIAFFNVIGSLIMMMLDKKQSLNTLFNMGVSIKDIRKVFFYQGSLMSIVGGFIGVTIGLILILNQLYGPDFLKIYITPDLVYPTKIKLTNIVLIFVTISALGILASKIASARITKKLVKNI
ncbi:ABC transporter permease [Seonamhaeicola marinus]|uniref:FtsX-like permease family protein n=1 Tax=Seonamhaeicola marinus TaxID=1912246 RepID=A0A5D0HS87_9FLAO|nr:FtsX-like permease family protein [Seonamhaeicola marinus]TYA74223.1 FtsX-like permease family protein [Seonamhaeicola marinus]